jgi:hypothetical protein
MRYFVALLLACTALAGTPIPDRCRSVERGRQQEFEVARDELYVTTREGERQVIQIAPLTSVEEVRQHARSRGKATNEE